MNIYIEEKEKSILSKKHIDINNICAIIYDQLSDIYKNPNYKCLTLADIKLNHKTQKLVKELQSNKIHILDWLKENELNDELTNVLTKNITLAVVSDFLNFVFESLSNAKRGKMTVAYALLRKPFMDELLILEQLLIDPQEFIQRFYHSGEPDNYDPSHQNLNKKEIIKKAISKINPNLIYTEELIFDLRYNKNTPSGLNRIANHALHIVTRDKHYKTENQNLNFVFSNEEDIKDYWNHYYYFVPYILIYSASVIDSILFNHLTDIVHKDLKVIKELKRFIATLLLTEKTSSNEKNLGNKLYKALSQALSLTCKKCKHNIKLTKPDFKLFFTTEIFLCPTCFQKLQITNESIESLKNLMNNLNKIEHGNL